MVGLILYMNRHNKVTDVLYAVFPLVNEPKAKCTEEEKPSCKRFIECKKCGFCQF